MIGPNAVVLGDCLSWLDRVAPGSVDLVYIDPPFFTQRNFGDFDDRWDSSKHYIDWVGERVVKLHKVLKPTGSIMLHCDWHASHQLRVMLDDVFCYKNFVNEIIWHYAGGGSGKSRWSRKHDNIYFYSKSKNYFFDGMKSPSSHTPMSLKRWSRGVISVKGGKYVYDMSKGKIANDVWYFYNLVGNKKESLGYPTQKPVALLERIIKCTSKPGDIVLDCFGGSGTTATVAHKLGRQFITGDKSPRSIEVMTKRLNSVGAKFVNFT